MPDSSKGFMLTVHSFLDSDWQHLTRMGLSEDETLNLLSEYIILLFDKFETHMQELQEFSSVLPTLEFIANLIWVNMQIHQEMARLTAYGLKNDSTFASAFIRFLTKATADSSAASVSKDLKSLTTKVEGYNIKHLKADVKGLGTTSHTNTTDITRLRDKLKKKKDK